MPDRIPPRSDHGAADDDGSSPFTWPGKSLGLPAEGPRSVASLGRRFLALMIDWLAATAGSFVFFRRDSGDTDPLITLAVFAGMTALLLILVGPTIGQAITRIRVVPITGGPLAPWRALARTALLVLAIPAVMLDSDRRGVHDRVAGTVMVRL